MTKIFWLIGVLAGLGWSAMAGVAERVVEGGGSPNGVYEWAITGSDEVLPGNLVLRETKSHRVLGSTDSNSHVAFRDLQEPFGVHPNALSWNTESRLVALDMHKERHRSQLFVFRVAGRSVRQVPIADADWLSPLGWISASELVCQDGGDDALILRIHEQPLRASVVATTQTANAYWETSDAGDLITYQKNAPHIVENTDLGASSPAGRYALVTRWDTEKRGPEEIILREAKTGKNLFNPANLPPPYLGVDNMLPGRMSRWSPDGQWLVFPLVIDYGKTALVGFHVEDSVAQAVKIPKADGLSPYGWISSSDLICGKPDGGATILRFRKKTLSAVVVSTTPAVAAKEEEEEDSGGSK